MTKNNFNILYWDIEILPHKVVSYAWEHPRWNPPFKSEIDEHSSIYSIAWAFNSEKPKCIAVNASDVRNDKKLLEEFSEIISQADFIVHHNGDKFDLKFFNARCITLGLKPPANPLADDTLKLARQKFAFRWSNGLNHLCKLFNIPEKKQTGPELWQNACDGCPKARKVMIEYNKHDVVMLRELHKKLLPYVNSKINKAIMTKDKTQCTSCGALNSQKRGTSRTKVSLFQRYQCQSCGKWFQGEKIN